MKLLREVLGEDAGKLYDGDPSQRLTLLRHAARGGWPDIWSCEGEGGIGRAVSIICLGFPGASEEREPLVVAAMVAQVAKARQVLPLLSEDEGMTLCGKTLVSLSIFMPAMVRRWERRGAPKPEFYRRTSVAILERGPTAAHRALGCHHQAWENFLHEQLAPEGSVGLDTPISKCDIFT